MQLVPKQPDRNVTEREVRALVELRDVDGLVNLVHTEREERFLLQVKVQDLLHAKWSSSSEKLTGDQFELIKLAEQSGAKPDEPLPTAPVPPAKAPQPRRKRGGRKPLPASLPRDRVVVEPDEAELAAAFGTGTRVRIGEDVREVLNFIPAQLRVTEYVYPKYACETGEPSMMVAPRVGVPIEGAIPSASLLAHVVVLKFIWHMPLHRISKMLAMMGAPISAATLCNWIKSGAALLQAWYLLLKEATLADYLVGTDDTPVSVLDENHKNGIRKGRMWLHMGEGAHFFEFHPDWTGGPVRETLAPHKGPIQMDGYKGLQALFSDLKTPREKAGCWMHARRGFFKALEGGDERAAFPMAIIKRLYAVEECANLWSLKGDQRRDFRQKHSAPLCTALKNWLDTDGKHAIPKGPLGKAVTYATNQWASLLVFLKDGRIPLDNGRVERGLRRLTLGRNAWLFFGADTGGERAAIIYTVVGNCLLHGVDPEAWLNDVFSKIASGWKGKAADLLPATWAKNQAKKADSQPLAVAA